MAEYLGFSKGDYPEVLRIANELGELENRKPTDSLKILIEDDGQKKIDRLIAVRRANQERPSTR